MTEKIHYVYGGSSIARIINCPASVQRSEGVHRRPAGPAADIGNLIHDALESFYSEDIPLENMLGELTYNGFVFGDRPEDLEITQDCIIAAEKVFDAYDIEELVCEPFVKIADGIGGSVDVIAISDDRKTAIILDWKTGRKGVKPEKLAQILFYTLCAIADSNTAHLFKDVEKFVGVIVQPPVYGQEAAVWEFTREDLITFKAKMLEAVRLSELDNPPAKINDGCFFCPASPICPDRKAQAHSALVIDPKDANKYKEALDLATQLEPWIASVRAQVEAEIMRGVIVEGYKLVEKRATKKWLSDEGALAAFRGLGPDWYVTKCITPTQALKIIKKQKLNTDISELYEAKSSGLKLVTQETKGVAFVYEENLQSLNKLIDKKTTPS